MGKISYYTVNGKIRGQHVQGEAEGKDYLLDASGNLVGVYQGDYLKADAAYDPFGNILDSWNISFYNFTWAGGHGYRQTGLAYSSVYVRARHYSNLDAGWTTRDPLWPSEMPYGYVNGRVPGGVDYWGTTCSDLGRGAFIKKNCAAIKKAAKKRGIPCNLLAVTIFLEMPGPHQSFADFAWEHDGRLNDSTPSIGIPQITIYEDSNKDAPSVWKLKNVFLRFAGRKCCEDAIRKYINELDHFGRDINGNFICSKKERDVAMMRRCIANCLYNDPDTWAEEAARHLQEDCLFYLRKYKSGVQTKISELTLGDLALCAAIYNRGNLAGTVAPYTELGRAYKGGRSTDFLRCYDHVNKQCCNDKKLPY